MSQTLMRAAWWPLLAPALWVASSSAQVVIESQTLEAMLERANAVAACTLSEAREAADRGRRNALVWAERNGSLGALVFRIDMPPTTVAARPCWTSPGRCAVYEGPVPVTAAACPGQAGFGSTLAANVYRLEDRRAADPALVAFAGRAITLLEGLQAEDDVVTLLGGVPVWMSTRPDGARRVRLGHPAGNITIDRMRVSLTEIDVNVLAEASRKLGSRNFSLVGPRAALSRDGRLFSGGNCTELVTPSEMRQRLIAANRVIQMESVPTGAAAESAAFDDLAQVLLGGTVFHGPPIHFRMDQDPRVVMLKSDRMDLCR